MFSLLYKTTLKSKGKPWQASMRRCSKGPPMSFWRSALI